MIIGRGGGRDCLKNTSLATPIGYVCLVPGTLLGWGLPVRHNFLQKHFYSKNNANGKKRKGEKRERRKTSDRLPVVQSQKD